MADNAVATREISRTWNELDWAWILKHWRNYSVCDGNLQNCPSLPRRAQLSDRRTLVERLFSVFHPEGNFHGEVLRISKKRSWHTLHQLSRSDRFYKITTYRLSEVENITRNFRIFFFFFFWPMNQIHSLLNALSTQESKYIGRDSINQRTNAGNDMNAWIIYKNN